MPRLCSTKPSRTCTPTARSSGCQPERLYKGPRCPHGRPRPRAPTPVDAITHDDKRANLPTADAQDFVAPEIEQPIPVRYPRDPSLDPQLVWKGKDELDGEDLVADAPPIYIQEKIDPRVLIENLRDTAARPRGRARAHACSTPSTAWPSSTSSSSTSTKPTGRTG